MERTLTAVLPAPPLVPAFSLVTVIGGSGWQVNRQDAV